MNLYGYVQNNPVNAIDLDGLFGFFVGVGGSAEAGAGLALGLGGNGGSYVGTGGSVNYSTGSVTVGGIAAQAGVGITGGLYFGR